MHRILNETGASEYKGFLSGSENFRYAIDPNYKANRTDKPRPEWLQPIRERLVTEWHCSISDGIEADDNLGIEQSKFWDVAIAGINYSMVDTCIVSLDKDLKQVPGKHYNWVKQEWEWVDEHQGWVNFYTQLVLGDRADNILGYDGLMRQAVPKFLQPIIQGIIESPTPADMYRVVEEIYELEKEAMHRNAQLLYILRKEGDKFVVPE